jgi:broad-specificity NMP kinase
MAPPAVLVVTGASGVGKTAVIDAVEARGLPGVRCYHFDAIGVPSLARMVAEFGSPQAWQVTTTHQWIGALAANPDQSRLAILEGQVRPSVVREALASHGVTRNGILLLDCAQEVRHARLQGSGDEPELAAPAMNTWAAYLRGQADALGLPVLDTSELSIEQAADRVVNLALTLLEPAG